MLGADNFHSRLVGWSKILLPLAALALLSTLFLFARKTGGTADIPFAQINDIAREQGVTAPEFSGVATDGSIIRIAARAARPDATGRVTITSPRLSLEAADGTSLQITAGEGRYDDTARTAHLTGLARLETSSGYTMETTGLMADLGTGIVTSDGALEIQSPMGSLVAGQVRIYVATDGTGQQMDFTGGVKMIYLPPAARP
jgi:lipopolysaccharide export system protein LptC